MLSKIDDHYFIDFIKIIIYNVYVGDDYFMNEIWKVIEALPEYEVSNTGIVRERSKTVTYCDENGEYSVDVPAMQIPVGHTSGREYVTLKGEKYQVHRLVAETFLDKPENSNLVEHIDGNITNNNVENLRWTYPYANADKSNISKNHTTPVRCLDDDLDFESIRDCAEHYDIAYDKLIYAVKHGSFVDGKRIVEL